jgi:ComF family protein
VEHVLSVCHRALLALLSPPRCAACDEPIALHGFLCAICDDGNAPLVDELAADVLVVAGGPYGGGVARAITRFKYGSRPELAAPLAARLFAALSTANIDGPAVFVPVPLHPHKLARRGFNQSALVAGHLARFFGWPCRARALVRTRDTTEQASLTREERLQNVASAIAPRETLATAHVLLVDDVVTTGATAMACVSALRDAGAGKVTVVAVARAAAVSPETAAATAPRRRSAAKESGTDPREA